jgi:DNA polymerase-3 subunit delta'
VTPLINSDTQHSLEALLATNPHALLISGPEGSGLATISSHYAKSCQSTVLTVLPEKDEKINIEKGTITVESIRRLYDTTRTREPRGRLIIIDYAERMAPAAQNAFLKLLEEPSEGTRFMLLSHQPESMLPTIRSRVQRIDLRPISLEQSNALLDRLKVIDQTKRAQLLFIAEGLPAELTRLAKDSASFEHRAAIVRDARTLVTGTAYDRLLVAKKYKDSRPDALTLLNDATKLLRRTIATNGDTSSLRLLTRLEKLHKRLSEQGNVRLQLSASIVS